MIIEYYLVGGYIKIHKNLFVQELLVKESMFRALLNWKSTKDFSIKHPNVSGPDEDNILTISFDTESSVIIGESPKELLGAIKAKYKEKIKGRVACRVEYSTFGGIFNFEVDLNSEDGEWQYITK